MNLLGISGCATSVVFQRYLFGYNRNSKRLIISLAIESIGMK